MNSRDGTVGAVVGIIVGPIIAVVVYFFLTAYDPFYEVMTSAGWWWLYAVGIPVLIGGFAAGAIAGHYGWIIGLVATFLCFVFLQIDFIDFWHNDWLSLILGMMTGSYGGFLGSNMSQIFPKRNQE